MYTNLEAYHKSISNEFKICKNRVRNLIGNRHWGEDGRYKEIILMNILKRFLPKQLSIGTGFVIGENDCSKQIDLIIFDNRFPIIFSEGDFVILSHQNVVGIIEVKTRVLMTNILEIVATSNYNGNIIGQGKFNGIFAYEVEHNVLRGENLLNINLSQSLEKSKGIVNHLALGENYFIKYWSDQNPDLLDGQPCYSIYEIDQLSFPYFISNLIETCIRLSASNTACMLDFSRTLYSIPQGKENLRIYNLEL